MIRKFVLGWGGSLVLSTTSTTTTAGWLLGRWTCVKHAAWTNVVQQSVFVSRAWNAANSAACDLSSQWKCPFTTDHCPVRFLLSFPSRTSLNLHPTSPRWGAGLTILVTCWGHLRSCAVSANQPDPKPCAVLLNLIHNETPNWSPLWCVADNSFGFRCLFQHGSWTNFWVVVFPFGGGHWYC